MAEKREITLFVVGKPEGMRPFERPRRRWMGNIKRVLLKVDIRDENLIELSQDRIQ